MILVLTMILFQKVIVCGYPGFHLLQLFFTARSCPQLKKLNVIDVHVNLTRWMLKNVFGTMYICILQSLYFTYLLYFNELTYYEVMVDWNEDFFCRNCKAKSWQHVCLVARRSSGVVMCPRLWLHVWWISPGFTNGGDMTRLVLYFPCQYAGLDFN